MRVFDIFEDEIDSYLNDSVEISSGYWYNQAKLIKRIYLYANCIYPNGKLDSQGRYRYFFDIASPRIDSEVKNVDFDTKNVVLATDSNKDYKPLFIANNFLRDYMRESGQSTKIDEIVEEGSGWGNVVLKKIKGGYERVDLKNFYVINQTAESLDESPVIERHILTQSNLRAKQGIWNNVEKVIKECGNKEFSVTAKSNKEDKTTPYYEIYERNGEISQQDLYEAQDKKGGDKDTYVLAKIICAGLAKNSKDAKYILFAEELKDDMSSVYKEYHRGRYNGRWWRVGIHEMLFDITTRSNEIGNQIARGLEWASKTIFRSADKLLTSNVLTDLNNGDIIKSTDISQVEIRMQGLDQLMADWNRLMTLADKLCNSYEVVLGENMPSGTSMGLGNMLNQNANKLFDFIRKKLSQILQDALQDWVLPDILKKIKVAKYVKITGDSNLGEYHKMLVDGWYLKNLIAFGPHTEDVANLLKEKKLKELSDIEFIKIEKDFWEDFEPRVVVVISGENVNKTKELTDLSTFIQLESDPVRRSALVEMAMAKQGIDISSLPKTEQPPIQPSMPTKGQPITNQLTQ